MDLVGFLHYEIYEINPIKKIYLYHKYDSNGKKYKTFDILMREFKPVPLNQFYMDHTFL